MVEIGAGGFAKRAEEFRQKGEAALKGSFFGNMFGSKADRVD
jgi:alpha-soluble NSF attachment protein